MTFGKPAGPPASAQQMRRLNELIVTAGHEDFRDARGPLGLNQRQAAGRFTRDEADELIERLEAEEHEGVAPAPMNRSTPQPKMSESEQRARDMPDSILAAELQRRGWIVVEP
jgi:hypothetical protein